MHETDLSLDAVRDGAGHLRRDGVVVGAVASVVRPRWTWGLPPRREEIVELHVDLDGEPRQVVRARGPQWPGVAEALAGRLSLPNGGQLDVAWLEGPERYALWRRLLPDAEEEWTCCLVEPVDDTETSARAEAARAVLDLVRPELTTAMVDAYADDDLPAEVAAAQEAIRARSTRTGGNAYMGLELDPGDEADWRLLRTYAPWSIRADLDGPDGAVCGMADGTQGLWAYVRSREVEGFAAAIAPRGDAYGCGVRRARPRRLRNRLRDRNGQTTT
ncbi:hypothetical protein RDV89_14260 [Nocardioides zeae]|uniref:Uncharacterized protein n=1 Tax=Nocardioides imazamoxiresistens TaxID=3231893 RepID=A0ABU3PYB8_9ACTN|nr:hypothetical protein [Nocardioides zeae]MDT9594243.1 hypothetical protein [Nocardioides zeae]